ncbi:MAG TPA: glycosyltransferase [Micrococcaceae bacterium]
MQFDIVVATYNRAGYLAPLLESIRSMEPAPARVIVVDNASTDATAQVIADAAAASPVPLVHHRMPENLGGSGAFSAGVAKALADGADWIWVMDDDVEVLPDAIAAFTPWLARYSALVGRRYDANGDPFFWQNRFHEALGIFLPVHGNLFEHSNVFETNVGCFEGMLFSAGAVRATGLPDPRFFLTWDDAVYGWLMSLHTPVAYVNEFVLRKTRPQRQIDLGIRHLNDSSDLSRFYVMRNRAYVANYLKAHGRFNAPLFAVGTALTALKEILRLVAVEKRLRGTLSLWRGWRASRVLFRETGWEPMPPLTG